MLHRIRRPSPSLVVAMIALFFALGGVAGAVSAVPLAKRALKADNAKKLSGKTLDQVADQPGPAIVTTSSTSLQIAANDGGYVTVSCDGTKTAIAGGFSSDGSVLALDSFPYDDNTWSLYLLNLDDTAGAAVTLYAKCIEADGGSGLRSTPAAGPRARGVATFESEPRDLPDLRGLLAK